MLVEIFLRKVAMEEGYSLRYFLSELEKQKGVFGYGFSAKEEEKRGRVLLKKCG